MNVSEDTAKRIAVALERLVGMLEKIEKPPMMTPTWNYSGSGCAYCGEHHGNGLPCPKLAPMTISAP